MEKTKRKSPTDVTDQSPRVLYVPKPSTWSGSLYTGKDVNISMVDIVPGLVTRVRIHHVFVSTKPSRVVEKSPVLLVSPSKLYQSESTPCSVT